LLRSIDEDSDMNYLFIRAKCEEIARANPTPPTHRGKSKNAETTNPKPINPRARRIF